MILPPTLAELDEWEASLSSGAESLIPVTIARQIIKDERERASRITNLCHAIAGYPLGRPRSPGHA